MDATTRLCQPMLGHQEKAPFRAHVDTPDVSNYVAHALVASLGRPPSPHRPDLIIICVGTDRSTGDALGPLVGSRLADHRIIKGCTQVIGTLDNPVHAGNLSEVIEGIGQEQPCRILAVDACLGRLESVGHITVAEGPLRPGTGVNKDLPLVGDAHVTGIVNVGGFMEYLVLQNTRLSLVIRMADAIAGGIINYIGGASD
ncbi:MAG: spore protease YyaC [Firmicutes bacterium]|nr:spore protease YyaC [Bacillota bacterium]